MNPGWYEATADFTVTRHVAQGFGGSISWTVNRRKVAKGEVVRVTGDGWGWGSDPAPAVNMQVDGEAWQFESFGVPPIQRWFEVGTTVRFQSSGPNRSIGHVAARYRANGKTFYSVRTKSGRVYCRRADKLGAI